MVYQSHGRRFILTFGIKVLATLHLFLGSSGALARTFQENRGQMGRLDAAHNASSVQPYPSSRQIVHPSKYPHRDLTNRVKRFAGFGVDRDVASRPDRKLCTHRFVVKSDLYQERSFRTNVCGDGYFAGRRELSFARGFDKGFYGSRRYATGGAFEGDVYGVAGLDVDE